MPDGTLLRQDSTLERYDDAKPILDAEYCAERDPTTYYCDIMLMPITQWLVTISIKCTIWPLPPPPPTPYWPCNMVLTEDRQPQAETFQRHRNRWEQTKPSGKKPRKRRYPVPGIHVGSPKNLPSNDETSLPINHPFVHQTCDKIPSATPCLSQTPNPLRSEYTTPKAG